MINGAGPGRVNWEGTGRVLLRFGHGGGSQGERLHRTASGRRGAKLFGRYPEVPGLVGEPRRCRGVPMASQKHKFVGCTPSTWLTWGRAVLLEE